MPFFKAFLHSRFHVVCLVLTALALVLPLRRLARHEVLEGQIGKQTFVAHMTESWMRGEVRGGFPIRFFADPDQALGPSPWAEEVPLYHLLAAGIGGASGLGPVIGGRSVSFLFGVLLLLAAGALGLGLLGRRRGMVVPLVLAWCPAFLIYTSSLTPDLAALALVTLAYALRIGFSEGGPNSPRLAPYFVMLVACLMKYFSVFGLLALAIFDLLTLLRSRRPLLSVESGRVALWTLLAAAPTVLYIAWFVWLGVPNPVTGYRSMNGYGHLAGPFLFQGGFYLRWVTWSLIKNPTLAFSALGIWGCVRVIRSPTLRAQPAWTLLGIHTACYGLFSLIFASSFYVHDYYALPFLLPVAAGASVVLGDALAAVLRSNENEGGPKWAAIAILVIGGLGVGLSIKQSEGALFRLTNYRLAGAKVSEALGEIPEWSRDRLVIFASDFSQPVIPALSRRSGWAFAAEKLHEHRALFSERATDPRTEALVVYAREPFAAVYIEEWERALPKEWNAQRVLDESFPTEGKRGAATRLVVWKRLQLSEKEARK